MVAELTAIGEPTRSKGRLWGIEAEATWGVGERSDGDHGTGKLEPTLECEDEIHGLECKYATMVLALWMS